jgi:formate C-acetyltransferase
MTKRVAYLKKRFMEAPPTISVERAQIATESYFNYQAEPVYIVRAKMFRDVLAKMTITILPEELIAGHQAGGQNRVAVFPEYGVDWLGAEVDTFNLRTGDRYEISDKDKTALRDIVKKWEGKTLKDKVFHLIPQEAKEVLEGKIFVNPVDIQSGVGHQIVDYQMILEIGYQGLMQRIEKEIDKLDVSEPDDFRKLHYLTAQKIVCEAAISLGERYSRLAYDLAQKETDERRQKELTTMAKICAKVPRYGAQTFYEAIQSFWMSHLLMHIEQNCQSMSPGRFDQYMYPFLEKDLASGMIAEEEALELLCCLWIKFNEIYKLKDEGQSLQAGGYPTYQNMILGGQDINGNDATNTLSFLCLEAEKIMKLPQPSLSIRFHNNTSNSFFRKACEIIRCGTGKPAIYNDNVIIPSFLSHGVTMDDARNYGIVGCVEPSIPGKTYGGHGASKLNLPKLLEITLYNGVDPRTNKKLGLETGEAKDFTSFEQLLDAYHKQLAYFVRLMVIMEHAINCIHQQMAPVPFLSLGVHDCMETGKDIMDGGAHYNFIGPEAIGHATAADSLAVIKKLVFEEKTITIEELKKVLEKNFVGYEPLRQRFIQSVPKYGNDDDYVDILAKDIATYYCRQVQQYKTVRGGTFIPGMYPATAHVPMGMVVGATPDGRLNGTPLNDGVSPSQGRDTLGPTAAMKSVAKLDHMLVSNGTLFNMKFNPEILAQKESFEKFVYLLRTYFSLGGMHIQCNAISKEILLTAQKEPQNYADLVVRVAGYSAFFTGLQKPLQDEIISRTEHSL